MKLCDCLPAEIALVVDKLSGIRELRLKNGLPAKINVDGNWYFVGAKGLVSSAAQAVQLSQTVCDDFVRRACNHSVYAYEKTLAQGFFTLQDGCRVGVCGTMGGDVFRSYSSLCIRVARSVPCARTFTDSVVICGPPRSGKTTFLRDMAARLSRNCNVVVVDERGELSCCGLQLSHCDVFTNTSKAYAFEVAVRTMSPDWLLCDELAAADFPLLQGVVASGVKLAATLHANGMDELSFRLGPHLSAFRHAVFLQQDVFTQTVVQLGAFSSNNPQDAPKPPQNAIIT